MVIASVLLATGIAASASTAGTNATRNYGKRDLSDSSYDTLAIIHASIGSAATMVIFPLGVLGARGLRVITARWWWAHGQRADTQSRNPAKTLTAALQGIFGLGCIVAAFVLGVILVDSGDNFTEGHRRTGLVLLILVVVQAIFGIMLKLASKTRIQDPDRVPSIKGHPLQNFLHIFNGLAILGLGFYQTWSGFSLIEQGSNGSLRTPLVVYVLWGVIVGVVTALYLAGLGLIPLQLRKEEERRAVHFYGGEKVTYVAQTPAYGATTATATVIAEPEMRNRYMSSSYIEPRADAVALATPVDVQHAESPIGPIASARLPSSLEQEILDRQRRTSTVSLIQRS
ncbi:hypothetical protein NliqN6_6731 [Naganishia liquefaciens]|uniref:Cytochrome b561 domain-containing protein n=1 Tax=Naganishia liquefaciens TaxID=104408 RepID=A0A8H3U078_9TREE|nr:hypothetical protein NliqN6_6731 [Naganishia liquefaciens]